MKDAVATESVALPERNAVPGPLPRVLLAVVPVLSLGLLGAVPSLVLAWRRGGRADWLAAVVFTAVSVAWAFQIALTPEETHGAQFAADVLLLFVSTLGASAHCLLLKRQADDAR